MGLLGVIVAAGLWLQGVLVMLTVWDPLGTWQRPGLFRATVTRVDRDQEGKITGFVQAEVGDRDQELHFSKDEAASLERDDAPWVLQNYRIGGNRPGHFLFGPIRLLAEFPLPWVLLALWGLHRLRRGQVRVEAADLAAPAQPRKVWKDDFHERADRFKAPPKDGPPGPG